jgi:hypothetical protein
MILLELYIIGRLNSGKSWREIMASHIRPSTIQDIQKWKNQSQVFMASCESTQDLCKWQTLKEPKLVQLDKLSMWFTPMFYEGKAMIELWALKNLSAFVMKRNQLSRHILCGGETNNYL